MLIAKNSLQIAIIFLCLADIVFWLRVNAENSTISQNSTSLISDNGQLPLVNRQLIIKNETNNMLKHHRKRSCCCCCKPCCCCCCPCKCCSCCNPCCCNCCGDCTCIKWAPCCCCPCCCGCTGYGRRRMRFRRDLSFGFLKSK